MRFSRSKGDSLDPECRDAVVEADLAAPTRRMPCRSWEARSLRAFIEADRDGDLARKRMLAWHGARCCNL